MQHIAVHPPSLEGGLRLLARITGACIVTVFLVFLLGESVAFGLLNRTELLMFVALAASLIGILIGFHHEALGGVLNIAGVLAFYLLNFAANGNLPGGPIFPLMPLPGLLYLVVWWVHSDHKAA